MDPRTVQRIIYPLILVASLTAEGRQRGALGIGMASKKQDPSVATLGEGQLGLNQE